MTDEQASYRSVVRSTGLVGAAAIGVLIVNLARAKIFALLVGTAGIGLLGLLSTLVSTVAAVGGMGLNTSAVRELSRAGSNDRTVHLGIWSLTWLLASVSGAALWLLREPVARILTGDDELAWAVGWAALAVVVTILGATMTGIFQGTRRLGRMAQANLSGAVLGTVVSIGLVYAYGTAGLVAAVIILPLTTAAIGSLYLRRTKASGPSPTMSEIRRVWGPLLHLGLGVLATAVIGTLTQLGLRSLVLRELGIEQVGLLQAAFAIASMNVGLVLTAMAADYYPRLSSASGAAEQGLLLDQQLHIAALLSAPLLILLSAAAPFWLRLLFSEAFAPAAELLRLQVLAETIRLQVWALGFVLLARGDRRGYVGNELAFSAVALIVTALLLPRAGVAAVGYGYVLGYAFALVVTALRVRGVHKVAWGRSSAVPSLALTIACAGLALVGHPFPFWTMVIGVSAAIAAGVWTLIELRRNDALPGPLARALSRKSRR